MQSQGHPLARPQWEFFPNECPMAQLPPGLHSHEGLPSLISPCQGVVRQRRPSLLFPTASRLVPLPLGAPRAARYNSPGSSLCGSYLTSSRNNASCCPGQALRCQDQQTPTSCLSITPYPPSPPAITLPVTWGAPTPPASAQDHMFPGRSPAKPEAGIRVSWSTGNRITAQEPKPQPGPRYPREPAEHTSHFHSQGIHPLEIFHS